MMRPSAAEERTSTTIYTGKAGALMVVTNYLVVSELRDGVMQEVEQRLMGTELHFEGVEPERVDAIVEAFGQKNYTRACALLDGPMSKVSDPDILGMTRDFINQHTDKG